MVELYGAGDVLSDLLPRLRHLDLTRYVWYESLSVRAHGGYCDVFAGQLSTIYRTDRWALGSNTVKVAIKRLRVQLGKDRNFAKVHRINLYLRSFNDYFFPIFLRHLQER